MSPTDTEHSRCSWFKRTVCHTSLCDEQILSAIKSLIRAVHLWAALNPYKLALAQRLKLTSVRFVALHPTLVARSKAIRRSICTILGVRSFLKTRTRSLDSTIWRSEIDLACEHAKVSAKQCRRGCESSRQARFADLGDPRHGCLLKHGCCRSASYDGRGCVFLDYSPLSRFVTCST